MQSSFATYRQLTRGDCTIHRRCTISYVSNRHSNTFKLISLIGIYLHPFCHLNVRPMGKHHVLQFIPYPPAPHHKHIYESCGNTFKLFSPHSFTGTSFRFRRPFRHYIVTGLTYLSHTFAIFRTFSLTFSIFGSLGDTRHAETYLHVLYLGIISDIFNTCNPSMGTFSLTSFLKCPIFHPHI